VNDENFILHVVQCVSDYFAPHAANMQQILSSEGPNKYVDCRYELAAGGKRAIGSWH
jgi:hypothetical protein